jgi:hypothetical protein
VAVDHTGDLSKIRQFLSDVGIALIERALPDATFLPGLQLGPGCVYVDYAKLAWPGDILHEAGHLAVTPSEQRVLVGTAQQPANWPPDAEELATLLWSYAAACHIGIALERVFHPHGYKGDSAWLIERFEAGDFIGLPFLEWIGLSFGPKRAQEAGVPAFPHMRSWLRA